MTNANMLTATQSCDERFNYRLLFSSHCAFLQVCVIKNKLLNESKAPGGSSVASFHLCCFIIKVTLMNDVGFSSNFCFSSINKITVAAIS